MGRRASSDLYKFKVFFALICSIPMLAGPALAEPLSVAQSKASPSFPRDRSVYYPNSNYPAGPSSPEALPANRSLTIIPGEAGERKSHSPRGSGASEVTNQYTDRHRLSERDRFRPSRMTADTLGLKLEQLRWFKAEAQKLIRGQPNALVQSGAPKDPNAPGIGAGAKGFGISMAQGAAAFGVAMGMIAAIQLYTEYPTNPAAWSSYIESTASAEGLIHLTTFMAVAGGSYWAGQKMTRKMFGEQAVNKAGARAALYGGSLVAAVLAGTILSEIMADPNSAKCTGITNYKEQGSYKMDMKACDELWDKWQSNAHWNKMGTEQIMPMLANIMVAGGMVKAAEMGLSWVLSRQVVFSAVQRIGFGFSAARGGGPWVSLLGTGVRVGLFLGAYQISDQVFGVGQWTREFFVADWSFSNDPLGNSLTKVESNLLNEWARLKANDFQQASQPSAEGRQNSTQGAPLEFQALLDKYAKGREEWRKIQMTETDAAAQQWRLKSDDYFSMYEVASDFYREALKRLAFEKTTSDPKLLEQFGFNQKFVDDFVKAQESKAQPAWSSLKKKRFDGYWKYVSTYGLADYLVASMACGPEIEGYGTGEQGLWGRARNLWDWGTGNTTPAKMVEDDRGFSMAFNPPRIVTPIDSRQGSVCQTGGVSRVVPLGMPVMMPPKSFPLKTEKGSYRSLFDYIRAEVRPSVLQGGQNRFDHWWASQVVPTTVEVEQQLRRDYEGLLNNEYRQALLNDQYRSCTYSEVRLPSLESLLRDLGRPLDKCAPDATHRLSRGILHSLRDEMRFYMALQADIYLSNMHRLGQISPDLSSVARAEMIERQKNMLILMDHLLEGATEVNPEHRLDPQRLAAEFAKLSVEQKVSVLAPVPADQVEGQPIPPNPNQHIEMWAFLLGGKIDASFMQALSLYKILTKFELEN